MATEDVHSRLDRPVAWRAVVTMALLGAWSLFIMVYAILWAPDFSLFQSLSILFGSLMLTALAIAIMWTAYGVRHGFPS